MNIKKALFIAALVSCSTGFIQAQNVTFTPPNMVEAPHSDQSDEGHLSLQARRLKSDLKELGRNVRRRDTQLIEEYSLVRIGRRYHVLATLVVGNDFDGALLSHYGVKVNTHTGRYLTVSIPTRKFVSFCDAKVVEFIDVSSKVNIR